MITKITKPLRTFSISLGLIAAFLSCKENKPETSEVLSHTVPKAETTAPNTTLSSGFKDYWYNGEAEITTYRLQQARYGEMRDGHAVLIYVTEDFLPNEQVKADNYSDKNIPVLKLNATKNFNTGIYPYSIMQSTFYPVDNNRHAIKISASIQEWCGQTYTQLNNRDKFEVLSHSYFQNEGDQRFTLDKTWTENELWIKLRIDPKSLPVGALEIIPSMEFIRLQHEELKSYKAFASLENDQYTINYDDLNRTLIIRFNTDFPHEILEWEETTVSGFGDSAKSLTTKATKLKTIKSDYWNQNNNAGLSLRETLKLQ